MVVYAFDVDETLEVSNGPVKLFDLVKLRKQGHIVGLCGNWAMVTLHCPDWHHICSFAGPCGIEKHDFSRAASGREQRGRQEADVADQREPGRHRDAHRRSKSLDTSSGHS